MIENWNKYKDLEYYPNRFCICDCGGRIKVQKQHKYNGIPKYLPGHNRKNKSNSKEHNKKISESLMGHTVTEETKKRQRKPHRKETKKRKSRSLNSRKGKTYEEMHGVEKADEIKQKVRKARIGTKSSLKTKMLQRIAKLGKTNSKESKEKNRKAQKQNWENLEYKEKQIKAIFEGVNRKPNKLEWKLNNLLQQLFPKEWKYTGDGSFIVGCKNPDFININGQKKIIEVFGDYWHSEEKTGVPNEQHAQERMDSFVEYGYRTLIIWEHEFKNMRKLLKKLFDFSK